MLTLVLAESELELVPHEIKAHPAVRKPAKRNEKRASRSLLDASLHHDALKDVEEGERRGRPDLVHFTLLLALDSALNETGELRLLVHTRNDELLRIEPETRLMRNYNRFVGLMEQLFRTGAVPPRKPLMRLEPGWPLERVLREEGRGRRILFTETGTPVAPRPYLSDVHRADADATLVLGGFPKGDFHAPVESLVDETVSLGEHPLSVWTVAAEVIAAWEDAIDLWARPRAESSDAA